MRLIEGAIVPDDSDDAHVDNLHAEIDRLRAELSMARREALNAKRDAARALGALRKNLSPLYDALKMVFDDLDAVGVEDGAPTATSRTSAMWENWKQKLGVGAAKCIDAFLLHGEMNTNQLSIATGYHRNTVPQYVSKLNQAGLINKNGGRFSLKSL